MIRVAIFLGVVVGSGACGGGDDAPASDAAISDDDSGIDGDDAAPGGDGSVDAAPVPDARPPCNQLDNAAPSIVAAKVMATKPAPTGGPISDGTYYLTSDTIYVAAEPGPLGNERGTMTLADDVMQLVASIQDGEDRVSTFTVATPGGGALELTQTCPNEIPGGWTGYRVTEGGGGSTLFELHLDSDAQDRIQVWTLQ